MRWLFSSLLTRSFSSKPVQVVLRPYQEACLDACTHALSSGVSRIGVSLPTGSGKTTVFISLLSRISPPKSPSAARRSLIIVNSIELARQTANQVQTLFPNWSVEIEQGIKHRASGLADVTVATYQTLLQPDRIAKFDPQYLKAIIVDEAHHAAAPSYRRLLSHFRTGISNPDPHFEPPKLPHIIPIIGFSATFSRHDGLALGSIFERIVYHRDFLEMIKEQWLCDVRFTSVTANINLSTVTVNSRTGDFNPTSLAHVINTDVVNHLIVRTWLDRAALRKSTLVFCVNLAHVRDLTNVFRHLGIDARYLYSKTPAAERKALVAAFKAGQFPVLVNCAILTEGADIPNIDCVIVARPTRSRNLFAQMIGRGMRLSADTGKTDCHIIDFVDSNNRVSGVICTPTLFGLEPGELDILDETIESLEKRASEIINSEKSNEVPSPKSVTYVDHENPFSFIRQSSGAPHVTTLSRNSWIGCGEDIYVLECLGKGHIRIEPAGQDEGTEAHYHAFFTPANLDRKTSANLKLSPYRRSRNILTAKSLSDAIHGCDTFAKTKVVFGRMALGLLSSARWRKEPATEQQKNFISMRWKKYRQDQATTDVARKTTDDKIASLTKGEAANIISRLKHGAQARYQRKAKAASKLARALSKEQLRRERELVRVGPLQTEDLQVSSTAPRDLSSMIA